MDSKWLNIVAKHHKEYVLMVKSFGERVYYEDIVQEMYLRILKYTTPEAIIKDGKVSKAYIYLVLKSIFLTYVRTKSKIDKVSLDEMGHLRYEEIDNEYHANQTRIDEAIQNEMNKWEWYDKRLFEVYISDDKSMRQLAKETGISVTSIFNTIKICKNKLRNTIDENEFY
jgi:RNA polymerase sigma factor (sigma-70 family)